MSSNTHPQPIRTNTAPSKVTTSPSATPTSPAFTPTTSPSSGYFSMHRHHTSQPTSPSSPVERSFFGAITSTLRSKSRSRSRSRSRRHDRSRSASPAPLVSPTSTAAARVSTSESYRSGSSMHSADIPPRPNQTKRVSTSSSTSSMEGDQFWYGRHSNQWLFGGFSISDSAKGLMGKRRPTS